MKYFQIGLRISGRRCTVIGGGRVAARKVIALLDNGGRVKVISPELAAELAEMHEAGQIEWQARPYQTGDLEGSFLVIAATDDEEVQKKVFAETEQSGQLVNVADVPERCNFILPATVNRGNLTVSVSTGGKSPALARQLRKELEENIGPEYEILNNIMGILRPLILSQGLAHQKNKDIFSKILHADFPAWIRQKDLDKITDHLTCVLGNIIDLEYLKSIRKMLDCD